MGLFRGPENRRPAVRKQGPESHSLTMSGPPHVESAVLLRVPPEARTSRQALQVDVLVLAQAANVELALALVTEDDCEVTEAVALEVLLLAEHAPAQHVFLDRVWPAAAEQLLSFNVYVVQLSFRDLALGTESIDQVPQRAQS